MVATSKAKVMWGNRLEIPRVKIDPLDIIMRARNEKNYTECRAIHDTGYKEFLRFPRTPITH